MKKWNGCSSETKKCFFCNRNTSDYVVYELKGIELKINTHYECFKNIDEIAEKSLGQLKKKIKEN